MRRCRLRPITKTMTIVTEELKVTLQDGEEDHDDGSDFSDDEDIESTESEEEDEEESEEEGSTDA